MTGNYHQKQDLLAFGRLVQRVLVLRIITARNAGKIDPEVMKTLEELLPTPADVQLLLDKFTPNVNVAAALAELEPLIPQLQALQIACESGSQLQQTAIALRGVRNRICTAVAKLKADPR